MKTVPIIAVILSFAGGFGLAALCFGARKALAAQTSSPTAVSVIRMFTGDDGKSHVEKVEVPLAARGAGGALSEPVDVSQLLFRRTSPDYFIDWHNAPRRSAVVLR